jgi:hypothetical protein
MLTWNQKATESGSSPSFLSERRGEERTCQPQSHRDSKEKVQLSFGKLIPVFGAGAWQRLSPSPNFSWAPLHTFLNLASSLGSVFVLQSPVSIRIWTSELTGALPTLVSVHSQELIKYLIPYSPRQCWSPWSAFHRSPLCLV